MNHKRYVDTAACALLALILFVPDAGAQEPPDEHAPVQLGPIGFRPRLTFTDVGIDSNVFNESVDPKDDFTLTASPTLEATLRARRLRLTYTSAGEFVYYRTYSSERSTNRSFLLRADLDFARLRLFGSLGAQQTRARMNTEVDARASRKPWSYSAGGAVKLFSRTTLGATIRRDRNSFDPAEQFRGVNLATVFNNDLDVIEGSAGVELTPLTSLAVVVSSERSRFELSPLRDSNTLRIAPTITFSPMGLITGTASLGYRRFDGKDPSLPDYSGLVASGSLSVLLANRFKVDATFTRDVRYSFEEQQPYYLVTGGRGTVTTQLAGGFDVRVASR
ncbi:MAG: outer membrane beta-barrel protein [Acidobacteria bacterium]|nr:outer membrane beta-barrel protein [Acidobacteriota bacterium]